MSLAGSQHVIGPARFAIAVQALAFLAHSESGAVCSSAAIAEQLRAHAVFLRRVIAPLVRAGLVEAREGREGGYRLAHPAGQITLADVYRAVREHGSATSFPMEPPRGPLLDPRLLDALSGIMSEAEARAHDALATHTLAEVVAHAAVLRATSPATDAPDA